MREFSFICVVISLFLVFLKIKHVDSGECCRSYYDGLYSYHGEKWCPFYCCQDLTGRLYCCSEFQNRAHLGNIYNYCSAWWSFPHNLWAPVVIGLVVLAICIAICICCCHFCCVCF